VFFLFFPFIGAWVALLALIRLAWGLLVDLPVWLFLLPFKLMWWCVYWPYRAVVWFVNR
jgi:hypothetical protein